MTRMTDATSAALGAAAGIGYISVGGNYMVLAIAGAIIGMIQWFHAWAHADPKWTKAQAASEALKSTLFGLVAMPGAIDAAGPWLSKWGICSPSVKILIGAVAAFAAVAIYENGIKWLKFKRGEVR